MRGLIDKIIIGLCVLLIFPACKGRDIAGEQNGQTGDIQKSSVEDESDSVSWSSVTPEILWQQVDEIYKAEGPKTALSFIQRGMSHGIISDEDADQVRAIFLFELGRFDEAFVALMRYKITTDRPDLLRLRADTLWRMARYDDANRDFSSLYGLPATTVTPDLLYSLAKINDELGNRDDSAKYTGLLHKKFPDDISTRRLDLQNAILSENSGALQKIISRKTDAEIADPAFESLYTIADVYLGLLGENPEKAVSRASDYMKANGFDSNLALAVLRYYSEKGDFKRFETELGGYFEMLDAIAWRDTPGDVYPKPTDNPVGVSNLLGWQCALELGRGDRKKAHTYGERALSLYPYDFVNELQMASISLCEQNPTEMYAHLDSAEKLAPPSDVRFRVRWLQYSACFAPVEGVNETPESIADSLAKILDYREKEFPRNAFFKSARAEVYAEKGDFKNALATIESACELPGATRDFRMREAYFLVKLGRVDEAVKIAETYVFPGSPYLPWVCSMMLESVAKNDEALGRFALEMKNRIDPNGEHDDFFVALPPAPEEE